MQIELATVLKARYLPERLPIGEFINPLAVGGTENILELRRLNSLAVELEDIAVTSSANLEFEVRADQVADRMNTDPLAAGTRFNYRYFAKDFLNLTLFNVGVAPLAAQRIDSSLWISRPTTSDKIFRDLPLTEQDRTLITQTGVDQLVSEGTLPLERSVIIEREYHLLHRTLFTVNDAAVTAAPARNVILVQFPRPGEFLVLEEFRSVNVASNIEILISRDDDADYVVWDTQGTLIDPQVWIPATRELRIAVRAPVAVAAADFWFRVGTYKLNNILRARWGLQDQLPPETQQKVSAGVL